jgi:hypothetical protein
VLTFEKTYEAIHKVKDSGGFLLVRELQPADKLTTFTDNKIIDDVIASKFHHWKGETEPDGITVQMTLSDNNTESLTLENYKFYGFFDNNKIKTEHYEIISFNSFNNILFKAFEEQADYDELFIIKADKLIKDCCSTSSTIYYLNIDEQRNFDLVAKWQVYTFFSAFIAIDRLKNSVTLIEFGLD